MWTQKGESPLYIVIDILIFLNFLYIYLLFKYVFSIFLDAKLSFMNVQNFNIYIYIYIYIFVFKFKR